MEVEGNPEASPPLLSVGPEPCSAHRPYLLANTDDTPFEELPSPPPPSREGYVAELGNQNVTRVLEPGEVITVGHEFESAEAAMDWYNNYAKKAGFSTKIASSRKNGSGVVCWKSLACSKEGKTNYAYRKKHKEAFEQGVQRRRCETRCGCQARMNISKKQKGNEWKVTLFEASHNHALSTPSKVHQLRSHRTMSAAKKALMQEYCDANIPTHTQMRPLANDAGGPSLMGCTEKDINNYEGPSEAVVDRCDAQSMIHHFEAKKERNDDFFYCYETASDGTLSRFFWADSNCRSSYSFFGDVVVFDTTISTNKYGWYLASFVGVNHHRQTTVFGCGLLSRQTGESFVWLFSKFLEAMPRHQAPGVIITDQDAAIALAVAKVFPETTHQHCVWHILEKFPKKMNVGLHEHLHRDLVRIIMESETLEQFDRKWLEKTRLPELVENTWLPEIFSVRDQWVPAYVKPVFSAGILSSQRVESIHSFFKRYVDKKCSLTELVTRISCAVVHQRHCELEANHRDLNERPRPSSEYEVEHQMADIYTKAVFRQFQDELQQCARYTCHVVDSLDENETYEVRRYARPGENVERHRELMYTIPVDHISCSCRMFEFEGIPCRHMLCWLRVKQIMRLPEKYILRRWTKSSKNDPPYAPASYVSAESLQARRAGLKQLASAAVNKASLSAARSNYLSSLLKSANLTLDGMDDGGMHPESYNRYNDGLISGLPIRHDVVYDKYG